MTVKFVRSEIVLENNEQYLPSFRLNSDRSQLKGWKEIFLTSEHKKYRKKDIIVAQGQTVHYLYYIVDGLVEYTYVREDGEPKLLEVLGAGNIFGLQPLFGNNPAVGSFIALEDSVLSRIGIETINTSMSQNPSLTRELLIELSKITGGLIRQINERTQSADRRIEDAIHAIAEYRSRGNLNSHDIYISLSQDDLARITRTTRVTVTKAVKNLKTRKLIDTAYGGIIVPDYSLLCGGAKDS